MLRHVRSMTAVEVTLHPQQHSTTHGLTCGIIGLDAEHLDLGVKGLDVGGHSGQHAPTAAAHEHAVDVLALQGLWKAVIKREGVT